MITNDQIAALKAAAECVDGWGNCNKMWPASEEDGYITYAVGVVADGERYPVAEIDCAQYDSDAGADLADFYARANPAAILAILAERDAMIARAEAAERDAELLGFIEANPEYYLRQSKRHWWFSKGQYPTEGYKTMREAISAAMENEKC